MNTTDATTLEMENEIVTLVENGQTEITESVEVLGENEQESTKLDKRHDNPGKPKKIYTIHTNNNIYLDYLSTLGENTKYQYGLTIKKFLESLGQKTPKRATLAEIQSFVGENSQKKSQIKGFYTWAINNNVGGTADDVVRALLIWLL